jgi:hypothetical protein
MRLLFILHVSLYIYPEHSRTKRYKKPPPGHLRASLLVGSLPAFLKFSKFLPPRVLESECSSNSMAMQQLTFGEKLHHTFAKKKFGGYYIVTRTFQRILANAFQSMVSAKKPKT